MSPIATVSIITYNQVEHARRCVASVLQHTTPGTFELILTANGNTEAEVFFRAVEADNPTIRIQVVVNPINEGFIEPSRRALELCTTSLFVLLNDDATVPPGWLEMLAKPFTNPNVALTGPRGSCCSLNEKFHGYLGGRVEYLEGSCLAGRVDLLKKHGLFSPHLKFAYGEDSDLSLRMQEAGYAIQQVGFKIIHARGQTSRTVPGIVRIQEENHAYLRKRWGHYLRVRKFDYPIVVRRMGAHGDVLLLTPVLKALKEQRPTNPIYVHTLVPEVLKGNPHVVRSMTSPVNMAGALIVNLDGSYEANPGKHFVDTYAEAAGVTLTERKTSIHPTELDRTWAEAKLPGDRWVAIHPGPSTWKGKEWPKDRWLELIRAIRADGWQVVLVGSKDSGLEGELDLRGKTSVMQLAAVIARCRLFIGLDSFPMHASQAVGTPTIGLFGVTDPQFISTDGSWFRGIMGTGHTAGSRHRVNGKTHVTDNGVAMATITVEQVLAVAREGLAL